MFCPQSRPSFFERCARLCVLTVKRLYFGKTYSKLCVLAKMVFLGIAGKNSRFCQNSLTYRDSVMVIFRFFGSKWPQIRTTYLFRIENTYGTLNGIYQVNLHEKIIHNQNFWRVFRDRSYKLEKGSLIFSRYNPFPSWPSAAQDTYFYY